MKTFARLRAAAFVTFLLGAAAFGQEFQTVHPGVEFAAVEYAIDGEPVKINLLRLDLTKVRIDVHHALDSAIGTETTSSIAKRHGAVAAVNAGFFRLDTSVFAGDTAGILQIDKRLLSESSRDRAAMMITNGPQRTKVEFGHLRTRTYVGFGVDSGFNADGVNRERKPGEIIVFTPEFGRTTLANAEGTEIILEKCEARRSGGTWCASAKVVSGRSGSPIPADGRVISIANDALSRTNNILFYAKEGNGKRHGGNSHIRIVSSILRTTDAKPLKDEHEDITNGVSQLIRNGEIDITWEAEGASRSFAETRHPRTAAAKLSGGKFLLVTVDGRQPGISVGMSLNELALYLLKIGAADAINLDGGGSTTMVLGGKIVNTPSGGSERKIGDALVVTLRP